MKNERTAIRNELKVKQRIIKIKKKSEMWETTRWEDPRSKRDDRNYVNNRRKKEERAERPGNNQDARERNSMRNKRQE